MNARLPTANGPRSSRRTLFTVGVHSGHRSTSTITAQTRSGGAEMTMSTLKSRRVIGSSRFRRCLADQCCFPAHEKTSATRSCRILEPEVPMTLDQIRAAHFARPFRPFFLHLADGRTLHVPHPEFLAYSPAGR